MQFSISYFKNPLGVKSALFLKENIFVKITLLIISYFTIEKIDFKNIKATVFNHYINKLMWEVGLNLV